MFVICKNQPKYVTVPDTFTAIRSARLLDNNHFIRKMYIKTMQLISITIAPYNNNEFTERVIFSSEKTLWIQLLVYSPFSILHAATYCTRLMEKRFHWSILGNHNRAHVNNKNITLSEYLTHGWLDNQKITISQISRTLAVERVGTFWVPCYSHSPTFHRASNSKFV